VTPPPARPAGIPSVVDSTPVVPLWAAIVLAAASGPVMDAGFPDKGIWPLTFVGIGLVLVALVGRRIGTAALVGFVGGASFYFTHILWASTFLGPLPMSALAVLQSLFVALGAMAITLAYRWLARAFPTPAGRLWLLPIVVAGLWTAREAWSAVWPYGGFSWGRVAMSQAESPVSSLFGWLGISGVSFLMVLLVAAMLEVARAVAPGISLSAVLPSVLVLAGLLGTPAFVAQTDGTVRVAAVQGNGRAGYFQGASREELLQSQLDATAPLFGQHADIVLWPESSVTPLTDRYTAQVFDTVVRELDAAALIAGSVTERDGNTYNTSMLWVPGRGAVDFYDKKHPVPFGEYVPDRGFWEPFAPDLIGLIQREYTPGTTDMVMDVPVADGRTVRVGVNICFDIVDDQLLTESVEQGAQVIFAQSNNADFGLTDESVQQLAIAQIRAMELGRSVVNVSTVGITAVIAPDGTITERLPWYQPGSILADIPLSTVTTPAVLGGRQLEWLVSGLGLAGLALGFAFGRRRA
jgi:apolipoprotein N-acyltransferase